MSIAAVRYIFTLEEAVVIIRIAQALGKIILCSISDIY